MKTEKNIASSLQSFEKWIASHRDEMRETYFDLLRFQSISTDPQYIPQVKQCAQWVADQLRSFGLSVEIWETKGHPVVFAECLKAGPDKPTLLVYNHYDVQPVDPLELWNSDPFEPYLSEGQVFARGAQDNKGQCFYVMQAVRALMERDGKLPLNLKMLIEGEEEIGSAHLGEVLQEKKERLKADHIAIVDVGTPAIDEPAITLGMRGLVTMDVEVTGSKGDLHSGSLGGIVYNPNHALVEILAKLRGSEGKITIPGFYDDVAELTPEEKEVFDLSFDRKNFEAMFQSKPSGGEQAYSPMESACTRPTLEINGLTGGYSGPGFKTVIPAKASAKVSCRLVPDQNPDEIADSVANFIKQLAPEGVEVKVHLHEGRGRPVRTTPDSEVAQAFSKAYEEVFKKSCKRILGGGSIPIVADLVAVSGGAVILVGLGLSDDDIHAPNEHFGLDRIERGLLIFARAMELLAARS